MKARYLINPFERIAGWEGLGIGLFGWLSCAYLCFSSGTHFEGLVQVRYAKDSEWLHYFLENASFLVVQVLVAAIGGKVMSYNFRLIDLTGTLLFSWFPLVLVPLLRLIPTFSAMYYHSPQVQILDGLYIGTMVWSIVISYHAVRISIGISDSQKYVLFGISVLLAEIGRQFSLNFFLN